MIRAFVISREEIRLILANYDEEEVHFYLLGKDLSYKDDFPTANISYYDDCLNDDDVSLIDIKINSFLNAWYLNNGKDISLFYNLSLGNTFYESAKIVLVIFLKYLFAIKKIIHLGDEVYFGKDPQIFNFVIQSYIVDKRIKKIPINIKQKENIRESFEQPRNNDRIFRKFSFIEFLISQYLLLKSSRRRQNVMFVPAGKATELLEFFRGDKDEDISWHIPLERFKDLFFANSNFFYLRGYLQYREKKELNNIKNNIKKNIKKNIMRQYSPTESKLIIYAIERYVMRYFTGAANIYISALKYLTKKKINFVILNAETSEYFNIIGHAARYLNIKTALYPHGFYGSLRKENFNNEAGWIDYGFAWGKLDFCKFYEAGLKKEKIFFIGHSHYQKLKSKFREANLSKYRNALILSSNFHAKNSKNKIGLDLKHYKKLEKILASLDINLKGIKLRSEEEFKAFNYPKRLQLGNKAIDILYKKPLVEYLEDIDLIIGGPGTALVEAGLLGVDYFLFDYCYDYKNIAYKCNEKFFNQSETFFQIEEILLNRTPYRRGIDISSVVINNVEFNTESIIYNLKSAIKKINIQYK